MDIAYTFDDSLDYPELHGPDGFECAITEPEDRIWSRDLSDVVVKLNEQHQEIERLKKENNKINGLLEEKIEDALNMAHVIIENTNFPKDTFCKCEECKNVAKGMESAGYTDRIKDKWWENKEG